MTKENKKKQRTPEQWTRFILGGILLPIVFFGGIALSPLWFWLAELQTFPWIMFSWALTSMSVILLVYVIVTTRGEANDKIKIEQSKKDKAAKDIDIRKELETKAKSFDLITTDAMSDDEIEEIIHNFTISPEYQKQLKKEKATK